LSNSPEPEKFSESPDENELPDEKFDWFNIDISAPPDTLIEPANADVAIREPAKAVNPTFLKLFILITPYL